MCLINIVLKANSLFGYYCWTMCLHIEIQRLTENTKHKNSVFMLRVKIWAKKNLTKENENRNQREFQQILWEYANSSDIILITRQTVHYFPSGLENQKSEIHDWNRLANLICSLKKENYKNVINTWRRFVRVQFRNHFSQIQLEQTNDVIVVEENL